MINKTLILLFILMLDLFAQDDGNREETYATLANRVSCAVTEKEAVLKVDSMLKEITGIDSKYLHSENVYIRRDKNEKGEFCVEGIVTQKGFKAYRAELDAEYESIMGEIEDLNDGISYAQKRREVDYLYDDVQVFNNKVAVAEKLGSLNIDQIAATKKTLSKMINATPVATFKVSGCKGKYMTGCRLVFISSFQDESKTVSYRWNFGDGSKSRRTNPIHYFKEPGDYKVSLRITDDGKKYTEFGHELHVVASPKPKIKHKPVASFSTIKKLYESGERIDFIDLSSSKNAKIMAYRWSFGDGADSTSRNPKHSYAKPGIYKVGLEVINSDGLKHEVSERVQVVHPVILFGIDGRKFNRIVRKYGQPDRTIAKEGVLTKAYQYGNDWLLVKQNKVECRIKGSAFKTNLMGNPKDCRWYEKHAPTAMYLIDE